VKSVAIIGAGITGLTAAFYLKRRGANVTVFESSGRVGGAIQSLRRDGYLAEFGPNTLLETSPKITQLVRDAGLESRRLDPDPSASARFLVRDKRLIAMPDSPVGFLTTKLFSFAAKLAVLREPFIGRRTDGVEESIGEFVARRFNREFLDYAIDALVGGIYAGDPQKLSVRHAFPKLKALEDNYGSLIRGQIFGARERKRRGEIAKDRAPKFSFDEGLQVLPDTLAALLGNAIRLNTSVTKLVRESQGWRVESSVGEELFDAVIYCGTAHRLADLEIVLKSGEEVRVAQFAEIRHPPVASVVLGFRRADVAHACSGFGVLVPGIEGFNILGTIFSSSLFPNRAPADHLTLTTYVGGERQPKLAALPHDKIVSLVCEDLKKLLGLRGAPTFQHVVVYPRAIPQYNVGFGRFKEALAQIENTAPGLFFAGHFRDGVSLADSIVSGVNIADRVADAVS
jgi:oxygen-dependent protoporphyrinogen oxidase